MNPIVQNVIGGARRQPGGAERYRAVNPAKLDDVVAEYAFSSASDIAAAIDAARGVARSWRDTSAIARGETLTKAGLLLRTRAKELGALMTREMGKPVAEATAEADYAGKVLQFYGAEAQRPFGETLNSGRPNVHYYTVREPIGVIGAITPWNFPFSIACWKLGPALVAGNTVVWKPAPHHPFCSQAVLEALLESGLPEGVVNLVHGGGAAGGAIVADPRIAGLSFTGSTPVGQSIYREVSARLGRAQCEMGGKNALYVHAQADLEKAVTLTVEGAFRSAGQKCTATSRVLVDKAIEADFTERLVKRVAEIKAGDPFDAATFLGPVVDARQFGKVRGHIAAAIAAGQRPLTGGSKRRSPMAISSRRRYSATLRRTRPSRAKRYSAPLSRSFRLQGSKRRSKQ
jgi:acyl-CoA reductase-like NAD-dependent aldehyde dehydrogenase